MNNIFPFFRFPFYPYSNVYPKNIYNKFSNVNSYNKSHNINMVKHTDIEKKENKSKNNHQTKKESSKYSYIGPILINTTGFSNKEEPLIEFSGIKLYLDDLIILCLIYFLYKEDVKDDMLFILLILLLIG